MKTINENAIYILIGKILVDCHDIKNIILLGYEPFEGTNKPNEEKPVYRIIFTDDTIWESVLDKNSLEVWDNFKQNNETKN